MSINQALQHPNAATFKHVAMGVIAAFLAQHSIDINEQVATLHAFFNSDEFHSAALAVVTIFSVLTHKPQPQTAVSLSGALNAGASLIAAPQIVVTPK